MSVTSGEPISTLFRKFEAVIRVTNSEADVYIWLFSGILYVLSVYNLSCLGCKLMGNLAVVKRRTFHYLHLK